MNPGSAARGPSPEALAMSERAAAFVARHLNEAAVPGRPAAARSDQDTATVLAHARGCAGILMEIHADPAAVAAAWLFGWPERLDLPAIEAEFGEEVARIVASMRKLRLLREIGSSAADSATAGDERRGQQLEILRRMLLAMSVDVRVVLLRLASRLQTLRRHAAEQTEPPRPICDETLKVLAPLANRLGIGSLKWQLEDLAFKFLEPDRYAELAHGVERTRVAREAFVASARETLAAALRTEGVTGRIDGRPKHLYSLSAKMRSKNLRLDQVHDLYALRVIVADVPTCYRVLDIVHGCWTPLIDEFADYISAPKGNGYQSLHTVVREAGGTTIEVQIRTAAMDEAAEYGGAAHWQYKEGVSAGAGDGFEQRVAWLRQLLVWQREIGQALGASIAGSQPDRTVYALTPQGRVIALPAGATPIDFAYHLHTDLGHRCRGARVNGQMVPLTRVLESGDTVEIITARGQAAGSAGPSRDWLDTGQAYLVSQRARGKVRQWFAAQEAAREQQAGRVIVERALQQAGAASVSLERLADKLLLESPAHLFTVAFKGELGPRAIEQAARQLRDGAASSAGPAPALPEAPRAARPIQASDTAGTVLVEGVGALMTTFARCCHPVPPDGIAGFITVGKGVTIHRDTCTVLAALRERAPERIVATQWSAGAEGRADWSGADAGGGGRRSAARGSDRGARFPVELEVRGGSAAGLLQTVTDILAREQIPLLASSMRQRGEQGLVRATIALGDARALPALLTRLQQAPDVSAAARR